ncbi:hypothetical protein IGI04_013036 [Brassica rapa subsp. trilocularis]|uniref:Protein kinase domain-containing protein n=1 Tax=Brassica rapa subsp. trilocularis TaxID=1813537 RepID=A0ABQ7N7P0_BRACM|nr:hypothetical protein IGI04_013036 [Brassica rapa subsp. trilocularis]
MKPRSLISILCFVLVTFGVDSVSAQCMNRGYFTPNSTYDVNRRLIRSSLPSNVTAHEGFFFSGSIGQEPNRVYTIGMCLPGSTSEDCSACIKTGSDGLIEGCANQTEAYSWPGEPILCLVRYSNTSFLGSADLAPSSFQVNTRDVYSNPTEFRSIWEGLSGRMIDAASTAKSTTSSSNNHYIADVANLTSFKSVGNYNSCCGQRQGVLVMRPSCLFRWELYPFFKAFDNITLASPPPPPVAALPPAVDQASTIHNDIKGISVGIVAAITIPNVAVLILLVLHIHHNTILRKIDAATNRFSSSNKLGEGGFGEVHKGKLPNGTEVAVKRLSKTSGQGIREFKNEAVLVSKLQHRNLVRLLGFCVEGEEKILIYEHWESKSITRRYKINEGIARGIFYLHQNSQLTIIHRDLKPINVLLDANMNPKFQILVCQPSLEQSKFEEIPTKLLGPLLICHLRSDVYSFGVLVLEIISRGVLGQSAMDESSTAGNLVTNSWWIRLLEGIIRKMNKVTRCIHIALLCGQDQPEDCPMLSTIILMLTSNTITLPKPRLPSYFQRVWHKRDHASEGFESSQPTGRSVGCSVNNVTITELKPP